MGLFCLPKSATPIHWLENALDNLKLYKDHLPDDEAKTRLDYLLDFVAHDIERTLEQLKQPD